MVNGTFGTPAQIKNLAYSHIFKYVKVYPAYRALLQKKKKVVPSAKGSHFTQGLSSNPNNFHWCPEFHLNKLISDYI